jgi:MFS transporter, DHA1 family, multidrug resistance protein
MMIAPIVAPPIGGLLVAAMGWQAIFWYLALFGAASLVALLKIVPETLESSRRATAGLRVTLLDYAGLFRRGRLAWLTLSSAFAMAGLFAYIGSSSFVFVDHFGLPPAIYSLAGR